MVNCSVRSPGAVIVGRKNDCTIIQCPVSTTTLVVPCSTLHKVELVPSVINVESSTGNIHICNGPLIVRADGSVYPIPRIETTFNGYDRATRYCPAGPGHTNCSLTIAPEIGKLGFPPIISNIYDCTGLNILEADETEYV